MRLQNSMLLPLLVALTLRVIWAALITVIPSSDSVAYDTFAWNIAQGFGYGWEPHQPTAYWPVGTSAIYAALYWLFGHNYLPIVLLQILVGVAIVALSMQLAQHWFDRRIAVMTGWILACWPVLIQYTTILASELYFIFFLLLAFRFAVLPRERWFGMAFCAGVALAAASYVRPLALVMAPMVYAYGFTLVGQRRQALSGCLVATLVMTACIAPWTMRNWTVFDRFVPISTNGGANFWMGNNSSGNTEYMAIPKLDIANEADVDKYLGDQARRYIQQDPSAFALRTLQKIIKLHDRETIGVSWNQKAIEQRFGAFAVAPMKLLSSLWWWVVLTAAVAGSIVLWRSQGLLKLVLCPPWLVWSYFTIVHGVTVAGDRYHLPSLPFIAMICCLALIKLPMLTLKGGR